MEREKRQKAFAFKTCYEFIALRHPPNREDCRHWVCKSLIFSSPLGLLCCCSIHSFSVKSDIILEIFIFVFSNISRVLVYVYIINDIVTIIDLLWLLSFLPIDDGFYTDWEIRKGHLRICNFFIWEMKIAFIILINYVFRVNEDLLHRWWDSVNVKNYFLGFFVCYFSWMNF